MELILNLPTTCIQILRKSILKIKFGKLVGYSTFLVPNPCPSREMGDIIKYKSSVLHRQCRNTSGKCYKNDRGKRSVKGPSLETLDLIYEYFGSIVNIFDL